MGGTGYRVAHRASFVAASDAIIDTKEALGASLMLKQLDKQPSEGDSRR